MAAIFASRRAHRLHADILLSSTLAFLPLRVADMRMRQKNASCGASKLSRICSFLGSVQAHANRPLGRYPRVYQYSSCTRYIGYRYLGVSIYRVSDRSTLLLYGDYFKYEIII